MSSSRREEFELDLEQLERQIQDELLSLETNSKNNIIPTQNNGKYLQTDTHQLSQQMSIIKPSLKYNESNQFLCTSQNQQKGNLFNINIQASNPKQTDKKASPFSQEKSEDKENIFAFANIQKSSHMSKIEENLHFHEEWQRTHRKQGIQTASQLFPKDQYYESNSQLTNKNDNNSQKNQLISEQGQTILIYQSKEAGFILNSIPTSLSKQISSVMTAQQLNSQQSRANNNSRIRNKIDESSGRSNQIQNNGLIRLKKEINSRSLSCFSQKTNFQPLLCRKSMEMASKMENPLERLITSQHKKQEKLQIQRLELDNQYSYKPQINNEDISFTKQNFNNEYQKEPRWLKLYDQYLKNKKQKNIQAIIRERSISSDPEYTFKPKLIHSKETEYMYTENELGITQRSAIWVKKKEEKINSIKQQIEESEIVGCTFHPSISTTDFSAKNQASAIITEYNRKGIIEYFERVDAARRQKNEKLERRLGCKTTTETIQKGRLTRPTEFSFMKVNHEGMSRLIKQEQSSSNQTCHQHTEFRIQKISQNKEQVYSKLHLELHQNK